MALGRGVGAHFLPRLKKLTTLAMWGWRGEAAGLWWEDEASSSDRLRLPEFVSPRGEGGGLPRGETHVTSTLVREQTLKICDIIAALASIKIKIEKNVGWVAIG